MTSPALELSPLGTAALAYATRLRWAVFPLRGKLPAIAGGRGFLDATTNPEQIRQWWTAMPFANIGIATGAVSGIVVIDLDGPIAEDVFGAHYGNPPTPCSLTGRGRHLVFQHPGMTVPNSAGRLGHQIDVRGDGGYIVAPPSVHPDTGQPYAWDLANGMHPVHMDPTPLPERLRADLIAIAEGARVTESGTMIPFPASEIPNLEQFSEGERNDTLARYIGRELALGKSVEETFATAMALNASKCKPPLSGNEVRMIVNSLAKREAAKPKRTTSTGNTLTVAEPVEEAPQSPAQLAADQIDQAIFAGQRDATHDPRWAFRDLDRLVGPMSPGEFWVVGSSSGNGKTSLMFSQMTAFADEGTGVLYLPLEMDPRDLRRKWAAWQLGLDMELVGKNLWHQLPKGSRERHEEELKRQAQSLIQIPGDRRVNLSNLGKWMQWGIAEFGARIVVIDHFHRIDFGGVTANYRVQVTEAARALKDLAREHHVVVVATAQLNNVTDPLDPYMPPTKQRLKESSALHEEPEVVLMLSRRLTGVIGKDDLNLIRMGAKSVRDFADPNVMLVTCRKHRLADARACDRSVRLAVMDGKVTDLARSWQREPGEE